MQPINKQLLPIMTAIDLTFSEVVEGFQYSLQTKSRNIDYLLQNCDRRLIIEERNKALQALEAMRDKVFVLRSGME